MERQISQPLAISLEANRPLSSDIIGRLYYQLIQGAIR